MEIRISAWIPEKYLLIDAETGDIWTYDQDGKPHRYGNVRSREIPDD